MKNEIFYFSATGKSFWTALTLANELTNCDVTAMKDYDTDKPIRARKIGFVFPVYYGGLPDSVKHFLSEIKIENNTNQNNEEWIKEISKVDILKFLKNNKIKSAKITKNHKKSMQNAWILFIQLHSCQNSQ